MQTNDSIVAQAFTSGRVIEYDRGDTILRAGDNPSGVYLIKAGWVKIFALCNDGEVNIMGTLQPGDIFPLTWAITGIARDVSFGALEKTTVVRISRSEFQAMFQSDPAFMQATLENLARLTLLFAAELENLHYRTARERIAFRLLTLANFFGEPEDDHITISVRVPNEYIARSTNMTRETASRELSSLTRKKIIYYQGNHIVIADREALVHEAQDYSEDVLADYSLG